VGALLRPGGAPSAWTQIATGTSPVASAQLGSWHASAVAGAYTLKLVASDLSGKSSEARVSVAVSNTVTVSDTIPKFKWVMAGVPIQPAATSPVSLFGGGDYKIFRWDPAAAPDPELSRYRFPDTVGAGYGFWIKAYYSDLSYSYSGTVPDTSRDFSLPLGAGWNPDSNSF